MGETVNFQYVDYLVGENQTVTLAAIQQGATNVTLYDQIPISGTTYYEVTSIDKEAFKNANSTLNLSVPTALSDPSKGLNDALTDDSSKVTDVKLTLTASDNDTKVPSQAFFNNKSITSVSFEEGVTELEDAAFYGCENLETIEKWGSLTSIGLGTGLVFGHCAFERLDIPGQIETIGASAFVGCDKLTSVTLGMGVERICRAAFSSCTKLAELNLPSSLKTIEELAFANCSTSMSVTYIGSAEEWRKIDIETNAWGKGVTAPTINYTAQE